MPYVFLALILLTVATALCVMIVIMMAIHMLKPPRMTDSKAFYVLKRMDPSDLGLNYDAQDFVIEDHATHQPMKIAAWWIPAKNPSQQTVIIMHGYSDAKIGGIAWAPLWQSLGWNVLAIDLRAHGHSGGKYSTAGFFERHDLNQVIDQLKSTRPQATTRLAIFGVSLGATVAAATAVMRDDIHAVVMESPYSDYESAIKQHGHRLAMPIEWAFPISMRLGEKISGAKFDMVKPIDLIPKMKSPLLVIHSGNDSFVVQSQVGQIASAIASRPAERISVHHIIENCEHTLGLAADPDAYARRIDSFLKQIENVSAPA